MRCVTEKGKYFSVFNDHVCVSKDKIKKENLVASNNERHFPAIRLHYFGVDSRFRGKGYGEYILMSVFEHCYKLSLISGSSLITVQALNSSIGFYEKYGFITWHSPSLVYRNMFFTTLNLAGIIGGNQEKKFLNNFV
ncbi:GNAT family N-acetyltransferase [Bacillus toyonensis]|uniref:GNAT family N-acetyltransferase n=1 Tax=Bacillus toyonensis TaxID=155322 RepID=UPI0032F76BBB|nr:GNAT family N-acetyltransferase [Bacillus toyonensis]